MEQFRDAFPQNVFPLIGVEKQQEGTVRIMSFNIRCHDVNGEPMENRTDIVRRAIMEAHADCVGVQEATTEWMAYLRKNLPGYASLGVGRDDGIDGGEHCAIFYKEDKWSLLDSGNFWFSETPDVVSRAWDSGFFRICTWAVLQNKASGKKFVHLNSHFDSISQLAREKAAEMMVDFRRKNFSDLPSVFTGDMNSTPTNKAYKTMVSEFVDSRLAAEDSVSYGTVHHLKPVTNAENYIDYVLCSHDIKVKAYRTVTAGMDGRYVSDHFPVYADLVIPKL